MTDEYRALEAEQAVLGGIMLSPSAFFQVCDLIGPEDFGSPRHTLIFQAFRAMHQASHPIDAITVGQFLRERGKDMSAGSAEYLVEVTAATPSAANIMAYAEIVARAAERRRLLVAGNAISVAGSFDEAVQILSSVPKKALARIVTAKEASKTMYESIVRRYDSETALLGAPTGIESLDSLLGGLEAGKCYWIAARPGMGKTTLGVQMAVNGGRCLFFSFEMTAASLIERATANLGKFPHRWLRFPKEAEAEPLWEGVLVKAMQAVHKLRMVIDDTPRLSADELAMRAKQAHLAEPLDMIIIDHFGWLKLPGKAPNHVELGDASKQLKALAKDLNIPVVVLYQLNRAVTERAGNEPAMQDLRGSGQIEEDADVIVFLHRPEYYGNEPKGYIKLIGAKVRDGASGEAWALARLSHMRMESCEAPEVSAPSRATRPTKGY